MDAGRPGGGTLIGRWCDRRGRHDQPVDFDTGTLGGFMRCAFARDIRRVGTYCAWADHGTVGIGSFPGRALPDAGELFGRMRAQVTVHWAETAGRWIDLVTLRSSPLYQR